MRNSKRFINEFRTRDPPHDSFDVWPLHHVFPAKICRNFHWHYNQVLRDDFNFKRERERERERERRTHTHTGTHIDTRFSHCWNTLQRLLWGIPKGSSTSFEPAIPRTTALLANHYTTNFPPKHGDISIDITKCYGVISISISKRERERERETDRQTDTDKQTEG